MLRPTLSLAFLPVLLAALAPPDVVAQGSKADYERAESLARAAREAARSPRPYRFTADGDALWTIDPDAGPEGAMIVVDAATGERREAEAALEDLVDRLRKAEWNGPRRSRSGGAEVEIRFENRLERAVDLWWLDTAGERRPYGAIEAGATRRQRTFRNHVWLVTGRGDEELGVYRAEEWFEMVVVDGTRTRRGERPPPPPRGASPDGRWRASIVEHDLAVLDVASGERVRLTTEGDERTSFRGPFHWSPDGRWFVAFRERKVETREVHFVESSPDDRVQPKLHSIPYVKPGDPLPEVTPIVVDVAARTALAVESESMDDAWSQSRFRWAPDASRFTFVHVERGHRVMRLLAVDPETRAVSVLIEEAPGTFVDYSNKTFVHFVEPTGEIVWMSERSGWNHLHLFDRDGAYVRPLTEGEWVVRSVLDTDDAARTLTIEVAAIDPDQDPYHVHVARVDLDGNLTRLTEADGTHEVEWSPDGRFLLDTWSRVDHPPVTELRRGDDGSLVAVLDRADDAPRRATGARLPERFVAKGRDGKTDIWGVIHRPSNFDANRTYPVIEKIYAGPHGQHVP
ncbi:MAG: DPP IV N-terminal domain-containing protein, partial [Planctomycetota bacterium JB042]